MARKAIVVGLGRFGISLAQELDTLGFDVLALDSSDHVIENLQGQLTYMIKGDSTSEAVLRDLGIANYDLGIVAIGSDIQANIMTTILLKTLGVKFFLTPKASIGCFELKTKSSGISSKAFTLNP